jgi:short-subunit dehydrogenase
MEAWFAAARGGNAECMNQHSSHRQFALVTGASSGIGKALAAEFARHDFDLLLVAEDAGLQDAARELSAAGSNVDTLQTDLSKPDGVESVAARIEASGRALDAAAINAGIGVGGEFITTPLKRELTLIDLNCRSTVHLTKRILPAMVQRGEGKLLFTSSIAGVMATPYEAVYGASKAFVKSFAAVVRNEVKERGVTVTTLMPGPTDTNFFHRAGMDDTKIGAEQNKADPSLVAREGFDALMAGKEEHIAGSLQTKVEGMSARVLPEAVTAGRHGSAAKPGSVSN